MPLDTSLRIGAGNVEMDDYGGSFTTPTDLGKTHEDGIQIQYSAEVKKVKSAQDITVEEVFLIAEEMTLEFALKEHKLEHLALSFGHDTTAVVDDTTSTPKTKSLEFGARRTLPIKAFRLKIPQPQDPNLYDTIIIYRGLVTPNFNQAFTYQNERYIPIKIECLGDPNNNGKLGKFISEYN